MYLQFPAVLFVLLSLCFPAYSQLHFSAVPEGYRDGLIQLPRGYGNAIGLDPKDDSILYAAIGVYLDNQLAKIDLDSGSVTIVANGPFGNLGGICVLSATQMALVDNASSPGGPPDKTILLAGDKNRDGDFNDADEIREMIQPILTGFFGFSGAQTMLAPYGNAPGITPGSLMIQTADGGGGGEIFVIQNPLGNPSYHPANGAFFSGFDYNGGYDFDSRGNLLVGSANVVDMTRFIISGRIYGVVNPDQDATVEESDFNTLADADQLPTGISDLYIDGDDQVFCTSGSAVYTFAAPRDPLHETAHLSRFAGTTSYFVNTVRINSKRKSFKPWGGPYGATMIIGGGFGESNLLTLKPLGCADLNEDGAVDSQDLLTLQGQWHKP